MLFWLLALVLLGGLAMAGYYAGAIRSAFTFAGLLLASVLCMPLAPFAKPIVSLFDVRHPWLLGLLAPILVWILVVLLVRSSGEAVHHKVHTYFSYKVTDHERLEWERLSQRLGMCVGLLNGTIYFLALSVLIYVVGYFTVQVASPGQDPTSLKIVNQLAGALKQTRMERAIGSFVPSAPVYYDAADIAGTVYQNPLVESRLASYPVFLALMERPEFKVLSTNVAFQEFWLRQPPIRELMNHAFVKPLVQTPEKYNEVLAMLGGDLKDLKQYIETGHSPKYDDMKFLGRWDFRLERSYKLTRRSRPTMSPVERAVVRRILETSMLNANLTALLDHRVLLQTTTTNNTPRVVQGTWQEAGGNKYLLTLTEDGRKREVPAEVDASKLTLTRDGLILIFEK